MTITFALNNCSSSFNICRLLKLKISRKIEMDKDPFTLSVSVNVGTTLW